MFLCWHRRPQSISTKNTISGIGRPLFTWTTPCEELLKGKGGIGSTLSYGNLRNEKVLRSKHWIFVRYQDLFYRLWKGCSQLDSFFFTQLRRHKVCRFLWFFFACKGVTKSWKIDKYKLTHFIQQIWTQYQWHKV